METAFYDESGVAVRKSFSFAKDDEAADFRIANVAEDGDSRVRSSDQVVIACGKAGSAYYKGERDRDGAGIHGLTIRSYAQHQRRRHDKYSKNFLRHYELHFQIRRVSGTVV